MFVFRLKRNLGISTPSYFAFNQLLVRQFSFLYKLPSIRDVFSLSENFSLTFSWVFIFWNFVVISFNTDWNFRMNDFWLLFGVRMVVSSAEIHPKGTSKLIKNKHRYYLEYRWNKSRVPASQYIYKFILKISRFLLAAVLPKVVIPLGSLVLYLALVVLSTNR